MKIAVLSYSRTGNNEALAKHIAGEISAEHIKITEQKSRNTSAIIRDMLFGLSPEVQPKPQIMDHYDFILIAGPVWMGQIAAPLRTYLKHLKNLAVPYGFISVSGGALGPNPKLKKELWKRTGKAPEVFIDMHIADLLPSGTKPTSQETSNYALTREDIEHLTNKVIDVLRDKWRTGCSR